MFVVESPLATTETTETVTPSHRPARFRRAGRFAVP